MKIVGLIGGMGPEASMAYYRVMNREVRARLGEDHSARLILDALDFAIIRQVHEKRDVARVKLALIESAERLQAAGAEVLAIACNTVHRFASSVEEAVRVPLLHIADATGEALKRDGHQRVGLLGTRPTLRGSFHEKRLSERFQLDVVVPSAGSQARVHELIESELSAGRCSNECRARLDEVVTELARSGASAVILGCTEFGVAFGFERAVVTRQLPLYDTAVLHARALVAFALDDAEPG